MAARPFPEPPLTDSAVLLCPWEDSDLEFVVTSCQDPDVARFSPAIQFPYTEPDARVRAERGQPGAEIGDDRLLAGA